MVQWIPVVTSFAEVWIEIISLVILNLICYVTSFAEVWIEIVGIPFIFVADCVTSFAEVWIEIILLILNPTIPAMSLPSRKCGLKCIIIKV